MSDASANTVAQMIKEMHDSETLRHDAAMDLLRKTRMHEADINACVASHGGRFSQWDERTLYWVVDVGSFADALPLLELAESFAGDCIATRDWPEWRQRDFVFCWLRIACTLKSESESCKVVVKGYKEPDPILEFVCAESL